MKKYLIIILLCSSALIMAQNNDVDSNGKFSGEMIGDYYHNIDNHDAAIKDQNGFWFRRIYFAYDYKIDSDFSTRLRLEMSNEGKYSSSLAMTPVVKDAYLAYKFGKQKAYLGISGTPTFGVIESVWGYRAIEKNALDLQKMASSRDFGLSLKGQFDSEGQLQYHAMIANGASNKEEMDKGKSIMASVAFWPTNEIVFEVYGDYVGNSGKSDTYINQAFVGYKTKDLHGGLQFARQTILAADDNSSDANLNILSAFMSGSLSESVKLIGRVDKMFDVNPSGNKVAYTPFDNSASFTEFIVAVDYKVAKDVSIIPNVEFVKYDENNNGVTPTNDIYGKLTVHWKFK